MWLKQHPFVFNVKLNPKSWQKKTSHNLIVLWRGAREWLDEVEFLRLLFEDGVFFVMYDQVIQVCELLLSYL